MISSDVENRLHMLGVFRMTKICEIRAPNLAKPVGASNSMGLKCAGHFTLAVHIPNEQNGIIYLFRIEIAMGSMKWLQL